MGTPANKSGNSYVVSKCIGPGPEALHLSHGFRPDYDFQSEEIAKHYEETHRLDTYLGDWHTHPNQRYGILSYKDKRTLRRIANHEEARIPEPIMTVLTGQPGGWEIWSWKYTETRTSFFFPRIEALGITVSEH